MTSDNPTPGGHQLSASFAVYAQGIREGYDHIQALLDMETHADQVKAVEAFQVIVESQQAMFTRLRTLVA